MKVTTDLIESKIVGKYYFNLGEAVKSTVKDVSSSDLARMSVVTTCVLVLDNGFTITGKSTCVDPAIYDEALGQKYAYEDAVDKVWELEGYVLANQMKEQAETKAALADFADGDCEGCKI